MSILLNLSYLKSKCQTKLDFDSSLTLALALVWKGRPIVDKPPTNI